MSPMVSNLCFFLDFSDFLIFLDFDHLLVLGDQRSDCIACRYGPYGYYTAPLGCVLAFLTRWGYFRGQNVANKQQQIRQIKKIIKNRLSQMMFEVFVGGILGYFTVI